jgi:hypothetical protein
MLLMHRPAAALRMWRRCKKPAVPWLIESLSVGYKKVGGFKISADADKKFSDDQTQRQGGVSPLSVFACFDRLLFRLARE